MTNYELYKFICSDDKNKKPNTYLLNLLNIFDNKAYRTMVLYKNNAVYVSLIYNNIHDDNMGYIFELDTIRIEIEYTPHTPHMRIKVTRVDGFLIPNMTDVYVIKDQEYSRFTFETILSIREKLKCFISGKDRANLTIEAKSNNEGNKNMTASELVQYLAHSNLKELGITEGSETSVSIEPHSDYVTITCTYNRIKKDTLAITIDDNNTVILKRKKFYGIYAYQQIDDASSRFENKYILDNIKKNLENALNSNRDENIYLEYKEKEKQLRKIIRDKYNISKKDLKKIIKENKKDKIKSNNYSPFIEKSNNYSSLITSIFYRREEIYYKVSKAIINNKCPLDLSYNKLYFFIEFGSIKVTDIKFRKLLTVSVNNNIPLVILSDLMLSLFDPKNCNRIKKSIYISVKEIIDGE